MDLRSKMPDMSFGLSTTISKPLFVTSNMAKFCIHFNFTIIVFCVFLSNILTIAKPEISSTNGASILINYCPFGFNNICSLAKKGIDLFKMLKHDSHEFIMSSNSNMFFMPNTRSTFSCISDTNIKISNLWPFILMNDMLTNCPFPT